MTISGNPFIQVHFDFTGKQTAEDRQEYLEDLALLLETEYQDKICSQEVEYFYQVESYFNNVEMTEFEMDSFEMKVQSIKYLKTNNKKAS